MTSLLENTPLVRVMDVALSPEPTAVVLVPVALLAPKTLAAKVVLPPSATVITAVPLSLNTAILPVEDELLTIKVSAEPDVRLVIVVAPVIAVVPATAEPIFTLVVDEAVADVPMLIVWVAAAPAAEPIEIVLLAVEFPKVMPPVLLDVPIVYIAVAAPCREIAVVFVVLPTVTLVAFAAPTLTAAAASSVSAPLVVVREEAAL